MRGLGSDNIDFRLRQCRFRATRPTGVPLARHARSRRCRSCDRVLVVGSHPAQGPSAVRAAHPPGRAQGRRRCQPASHAVDDDLADAGRQQADRARRRSWVAGAGRDRRRGRRRARASRAPVAGSDAGDAAQGDRRHRCSAANARPILLGNAAAQHPQAAQLLALAQLDRRADRRQRRLPHRSRQHRRRAARRRAAQATAA